MMKLLFALAALVVVIAGKELPKGARGPELTAFGYLTKYGVPAAEARRKTEEKLLASRIIGGELSELGRIPYQAGILINLAGSQSLALCGGALISLSRVATAGHCSWDGINTATQFTVVLGTILLFSGGVRVTTNQVAVHSGWTPSSVQNDIAVLLIETLNVVDPSISPIRLPTGSELSETFVDLAATASGWGIQHYPDSITEDQALSHVYLHILSNQICSFGFPTIIQNTNLCTSGTFGINVCPGDSGGPIAINRNNTMVLVGIYSFGSSLGCSAGLPAIHTRVTSYVDFLNSV